jgi:hypothetical protein
LATTDHKFVVKNGLAVGSSIDVINSSGQWIGATGTLSGATGPTGATGITGASGSQGINGASGFVGSNGATGSAGATGTNGASGITGASGVQGASGTIGVDGATGIQGASGSTGLTGATGIEGASGITGATGSAGTNGASGSTGLTGATGIQGASGVGATGVDGATGIQGASGSTGLTGATGSAGTNGASGVQGASGATGAQGASGVGIDGASGIAGATGTAVAAATGATGYSGVFYATNQIVIGATGWSSYASPLGASGSLMVAGPMAVAGYITTPQLLVGNYAYTGLGATGATGTIIANNLKLVDGGFGGAITFTDGTTLGTATPTGYINGPISGHSLLIGATSAGVNVAATGVAWFGNQIMVGPQGASGLVYGATGSIKASVYVSVGTTGATGFLGATGSLSVIDGFLNNLTTNTGQFSSLGVGTAASGTAGEIRATNNVTAYYSDERLKIKLGNIDNALNKVNSLSGFYYEANEVAQALGYEVKKEVGVSAQEVQAVMPEVVAPAPIDDKYLTVRYEKLVPLLIEAIKELTNKINVLESNQKDK